MGSFHLLKAQENFLSYLWSIDDLSIVSDSTVTVLYVTIFLVVLRRSKVIPPGDDDLYSGFGKEDVAPALATHDLEYDPAFQVGNFPSRSERFQ